MRGHRFLLFLVAALFSLLGTGTARASDDAADPAPAPTYDTPLVRLSFVHGQVSVLQGSDVQFSQAQANMPLLAGTTLNTAADGQAEVEFTDGSVARLTPNSQLRLVRLPVQGVRDAATDLVLLSGLAYFELNTAEGQRYSVRFGPGMAQPVENAVFRLGLDDGPEVAVFAGQVRARLGEGDDQTVAEGQSLRLPADDQESSLTASIRSDSWDAWNQDRDAAIAREGQQQTTAREQSAAPEQPGWNDLDYYGDWYPTEEYGNVWFPGGMAAGWDPFGSGYWGYYPSFGYTWISSYPWGWLPYHCGAWDYFGSSGWGWIPGQCGGFQPVVTVWGRPPHYQVPPRPVPGGHAGTPSTLLAVHRGPAVPSSGLLGNHHTRPVRVEGMRLTPLPKVQSSLVAGSPVAVSGVGHVGVPVRTTATNSGSGVSVWPPSAGMRPVYSGQTGGPAGATTSTIGGTPAHLQPRPSPAGGVVAPAPPVRMGPSPSAPRTYTPPPSMSAPRSMPSAPSAPRMASPPPTVSASPGGGHAH